MWLKHRDFRNLCKVSIFLRRKIRNTPQINLVMNEEENSVPSLSPSAGRKLKWQPWYHKAIQKLSSILLWMLNLPSLSLQKAAQGLWRFPTSVAYSNTQSKLFHSQFPPFVFVTASSLSFKSFSPFLTFNLLLQRRPQLSLLVASINSNLTWAEQKPALWCCPWGHNVPAPKGFQHP